MSAVYFPVSKHHLNNIYMKKKKMKQNSNTDCVVNVKSVGISNELGQSLPGLQIYPDFTQNIETGSLVGSSIRVSLKVDFNVMRDSNIQVGLINYGENVCIFNSVTEDLYFLPVFIDLLTNYGHISRKKL